MCAMLCALNASVCCVCSVTVCLHACYVVFACMYMHAFCHVLCNCTFMHMHAVCCVLCIAFLCVYISVVLPCMYLHVVFMCACMCMCVLHALCNHL